MLTPRTPERSPGTERPPRVWRAISALESIRRQLGDRRQLLVPVHAIETTDINLILDAMSQATTSSRALSENKPYPVHSAHGPQAEYLGPHPPVEASSELPHITWSIVVLRAASHDVPAGTGPSETTSVTTTMPAAVHTKLVLEAPGDENVPLGADHQFPSSFGFGPVAVAVSTTELPMVVSIGLAVAVVQLAQA